MGPGDRMSACWSGFLLLLAMLAVPPSGAVQSQEAPPPVLGQSPYTLQVNTRVVLTDVTVTDAKGNPVRGLTEADFHVFDNGKPQKLASFDTQHSDDDPPHWYQPIERPDWWLVIIAALTGLAIAYQAREMRRTTQVMKDSLDAMWAAQRPQLALGPHDNPPKDLMSDTPRIQLELINRGMTTAYDLTYQTWIEVLPFPFIDFTQDATYFCREEMTALSPQYGPLIINLPIQREWSEGETSAIKRLELFVCFRIRVKFRDARKSDRWTDFGMYVQADGFGYLPKYNDDDTCHGNRNAKSPKNRN